MTTRIDPNAGIALTGSDLRVIADAVDAVEQHDLARHAVLGRMEVYRPDGADRIGWVQRFDDSDPDAGWGFVSGIDS